jgi:hypothetical protein
VVEAVVPDSGKGGAEGGESTAGTDGSSDEDVVLYTEEGNKR